MAIIENGTIKKGSTRTFLGAQTLYHRGNCLIMRTAKDANYRDRKSLAQMLVRYRTINHSNVAKTLKQILNSSWENMSSGCYYSQSFQSANKHLPALPFPFSRLQPEAAVLDTYQVTQGTLLPIVVDTQSRGLELGVSDILLGNLVVQPSTPLARLAHAILTHNGDRFHPYDVLSFLCIYQKEIDGVPYVEPHRCDFPLATDQPGSVSDLHLPAFGSYDHRLALSSPLPMAGYCWFYSRANPSSTAISVSTQHLILSCPDYRDRYADPHYILGCALQDGVVISEREEKEFLHQHSAISFTVSK